MLKRIQKQKQNSISSLLPQKKRRVNDENSNDFHSIPLHNHGSSQFSNDSHNNQQPQVEIERNSSNDSTSHESNDDLDNEMNNECKFFFNNNCSFQN